MIHNDRYRGSINVFTDQQLELFEKIVKVGDEKLRLVPPASKGCNLSRALQYTDIYLVPEQEFIGYWKDWCDSPFAKEMLEEYHDAINKLNSNGKRKAQRKNPQVERINEELDDLYRKIIEKDCESHNMKRALRKSEHERNCDADLRGNEDALEETRKHNDTLAEGEESHRREDAQGKEVSRIHSDLESLIRKALRKERELRDLERELRPWDTEQPIEEGVMRISEEPVFEDEREKENESSDYDPYFDERAKHYERRILDTMYGPWLACASLDETGTYTYSTPLGYYVPDTKEIYICLDKILSIYGQENEVDGAAAFTLIHELGHAIMHNDERLHYETLFDYWAEESLAEKIAMQYLSVAEEELHYLPLRYAFRLFRHYGDAYALGKYLFYHNLSDWFALKNNKPYINKKNGIVWVRFMVENFFDRWYDRWYYMRRHMWHHMWRHRLYFRNATLSGEAQYLFYKTFDF